MFRPTSVQTLTRRLHLPSSGQVSYQIVKVDFANSVCVPLSQSETNCVHR